MSKELLSTHFLTKKEMYYVIHTGLLLNEFFVLSMKHRSFSYTVRTTHFYQTHSVAVFYDSSTTRELAEARKKERNGVSMAQQKKRKSKLDIHKR